MANTYSRIHIHAVIAVKYRQALITKSLGKSLYPYMAGIIKEKGQIPLLINGVADHVHLAFIMKPSISVSDMMRFIKANSSKWINEQQVLPNKFNWQRGFGAFSFGYSQIDTIIRYIERQEQHHANKSFKREYLKLLNDNEIEHQEKYLFDWMVE